MGSVMAMTQDTNNDDDFRPVCTYVRTADGPDGPAFGTCGRPMDDGHEHTAVPTLWAATIAPVGVPGSNGQIIASDCEVTVRDGAPLFGTSGVPIGRVDNVSVVGGHLVATGTLDPGQGLPSALPTFDVSVDDTTDPDDGDGQRAGSTTFRHMVIHAVRANFTPVWSDPEIRFVWDWCVHVLGPDDLIPMPDHATAVRAADRFNTWWQKYRATRQDDGAALPGTPVIVRPWPYAPDEHASALADLRADDPDGWLRG